ncbi:hypothetical protein Kisp01_70190 [Kineosporia sp. NBRC 101677]|uniref:GNAT family N-acetyltransferase n=1 Tax=Kineosporia sp. NBRC 101677 TaxID=3032197 RepID=UPI0024A141EF|nr:GNAT family protein [Kineosporia sp. NBRC 101677]GLY20005.1 hypothetical protein Kisp01_70190 [Kineosporia sp. NBRC 101677]
MTAKPSEHSGLRLDGGKIVLRDLTLRDVEDVWAIVGDDRVTSWLSFASRDRAGAAAMVASAATSADVRPRSEYYLAVTPLDSDHVVGFARLALGGVRAAKLGYALHADQWGRGYATAAAQTLTRYAFSELDVHRITAAIGPENHRSIRLVEKAGFTLEGTLRDHVHTNGAWRDSLLYSLLNGEQQGNP